MADPRPSQPLPAGQGTQSVDRTLGLLTVIGTRRSSGFSLGELVAETGMAKATVRRLLIALMRFGFVAQDETTRRYVLGPESYALGMIADERFGIRRLAQDSLRRLAEESEDAAFLSVRRGSYALCLDRCEGPLPGRTASRQPGVRNVLGVGAGGLALLAALSDAEVERMLELNASVLAARHPRVSVALLRELVAETRSRGYALNRGMVTPATWGVGVVVHDPDGEPNAALSISTVAERLDPARQRVLVRRLQEEARRLEECLQSVDMRLAGHLGGPLGSDIAHAAAGR